VFGPCAQGGNFLGASDRQRHGGRERSEQVLAAQFLLAGESGVEAGLHGRFDFRAGKTFGGFCDSVEIVVDGIALTFCQLDGKYLFPLVHTGEVYKEELIEASFANQFRRQHGDVVAGGGYEDS
jgi:hypothetical protein